MPRYNKSKYTAEKSSEIRFNIIGALDELAINKGIDIKTMQTTEPYCFEWNYFSKDYSRAKENGRYWTRCKRIC